ncbi:MAG: HEAT repeat domain-containing protein [Archaeoglobus sp.]|nr:HEAT repeat domain-containing protein [Archaeoglobus sp.]
MQILADIEKLERKKDVKGLIKALKDGDSYTRWRAAIALKNIGDCSALPHLIELLSDNNDYVRLRAVEAIGALNGECAMNFLITALNDRNEHVRRAAIEELVKLGKKPIPELLNLLKRGNQQIRKAAAVVLDRIGWEPEDLEEEIYYHIAKEEWEVILRFGRKALNILTNFLKEKSDGLRLKVAEILGEIGEAEAIPYLKKLLNDQNKFIRLKAAESLVKLTGNATHLLQLLEEERDDQIKMKAIELIGESGDFSAIDKLKGFLRDRNSLIRRVTAYSLEKLGWFPKTEEEMLHYLVAKEEWDKVCRFGKAHEVLVQLLDDEDESIRCKVVEALGRLRDPRCVEMLIRKLSDESRFVRWRVAEALGIIRDKRALKHLIAALNDECEFVRWKAAEALGELGDPEAIEPLMKAMEDESEYVRWAAAEALWKIRVG